MTSSEHIERAETFLDKAANSSYTRDQAALALLAQAHVAAATFRKAQEDRNSRTEAIRAFGPM